MVIWAQQIDEYWLKYGIGSGDIFFPAPYKRLGSIGNLSSKDKWTWAETPVNQVSNPSHEYLLSVTRTDHLERMVVEY